MAETKTIKNLKSTSIFFDKLFKSKYAYLFGVIFYLLIMGMGILFTFYGQGADPDMYGEWYIWFIPIWTSIAGFLSLVAAILTVNLDKRFIYPAILSSIMWVVNAFLLNYWFNLTKLLIFFIPTILRWFNWNREEKQKGTPIVRRMSLYSLGGILLMGFSISILLGFLVTLIPPSSFITFSLPYVDAVNLCFGIIISILWIYGYIEGYLLCIITTVALITLSVYSQQWTTLSTVVLFFFVNLGAGFSWLADYYEREKTFKYVRNNGKATVA